VIPPEESRGHLTVSFQWARKRTISLGAYSSDSNYSDKHPETGHQDSHWKPRVSRSQQGGDTLIGIVR